MVNVPDVDPAAIVIVAGTTAFAIFEPRVMTAPPGPA